MRTAHKMALAGVRKGAFLCGSDGRTPANAAACCSDQAETDDLCAPHNTGQMFCETQQSSESGSVFFAHGAVCAVNIYRVKAAQAPLQFIVRGK